MARHRDFIHVLNMTGAICAHPTDMGRIDGTSMIVPPSKFDPWPHPTNFHVVTVSTSMETPGSTTGPWLMDRYGLAWIVKGHGVTHYDDVAIHTREGSVLMVRPGMTGRHDWGDVASFQCFIVFGFDDVPPPWPHPSTWPLVRQLEEDHFFFTVWKSLLRFDARDENALPLVVPAVELLLRIFVSGAVGSPMVGTLRLPDTVERAVGIIRKHVDSEPAKPLRLPDLARKVHVTPQHLCRLFKDSVGLGPIECAQALRLELASTLLERTELSLNVIAERFGFSSQFHFSKAFKHGYGMSPSYYRKAFRDGIVTRPPGLMFKNHPMRRYFYERAPGKIDEILSGDGPSKRGATSP